MAHIVEKYIIKQGRFGFKVTREWAQLRDEEFYFSDVSDLIKWLRPELINLPPQRQWSDKEAKP